MKFIIGAENGWEWLEKLTYRGAIGFFYKDTWSGIITYILFGIITVLAAIGLITVLKWILKGKKKDESPGEKWLRTGKL